MVWKIVRLSIKTFKAPKGLERTGMNSQDKYNEMMRKLQEAKETYLTGRCNIDELVINCALIGVNEIKSNFEKVVEKRLS